MNMSDRRTIHRVCPFCEATCGLAVEVEGDSIVAVRGDKDDPFSRGFICPKAHGLKELHHDPDRLRHPVRRTANGWEQITWEQAYNEVAERLLAVRQKYGNDAIGMYTGNPIVHDVGAVIYRNVLARALATKSAFNSAAIDTLPKIVQTGLMFGGPFPTGVPVPDIDCTRYLLIIGANPVISHGSLMTMPDAPGRLKGVIERGGRVVVIDPRRTETARIASEHQFIRPGTDAAFLLALVHTLFDEGLVDLGAAEGLVVGLDAVEAASRDFAPESVESFCGIPAPVIRRIAREFAAARVRGLLWAPRHVCPGIRNSGELGMRSRQPAHRQSRPPRRRDVHHARGAGQHPGPGQGLSHRSLAQPRQRPAGSRRANPVLDDGRGNSHPR
jgi:anaerobic selenocysteine-containing dehydrogenase